MMLAGAHRQPRCVNSAPKMSCQMFCPMPAESRSVSCHVQALPQVYNSSHSIRAKRQPLSSPTVLYSAMLLLTAIAPDLCSSTRSSLLKQRLVLSGNPKFASGILRLRTMTQPSRSLSAFSEVIGASYKNASENEFSHFMVKSCLLIVGPGVLGNLVATKWQQDYPGCHIVGQTMTTDHHDELVKRGINPSLKGKSVRKFPNIIFCAPFRTADYLSDISVATSNWSGEGSFLFTSSTSVYDCNDNGLCDEDCPVIPIGRSPRTDVLLKAENTVLEAGGCVLRLAGLYKADRGAHIYALKKGVIEAHPDHILNLIHYEDAASLAIAIMKTNLRGRIFLGCDNSYISWRELMDCVNQSEMHGNKMLAFTGTAELNRHKLGKKMNNSRTRAEIGWEPKYPSFPLFLRLPGVTVHGQI